MSSAKIYGLLIILSVMSYAKILHNKVAKTDPWVTEVCIGGVFDWPETHRKFAVGVQPIEQNWPPRHKFPLQTVEAHFWWFSLFGVGANSTRNLRCNRTRPWQHRPPSLFASPMCETIWNKILAWDYFQSFYFACDTCTASHWTDFRELIDNQGQFHWAIIQYLIISIMKKT